MLPQMPEHIRSHTVHCHRFSIPNLHLRMVLLGCVYVLTAVCMYQGQKVARRYYGMFKIRSSQSKKSARSRREWKHVENPVAWLSSSDPHTVHMTCVGHAMDYQMALVEEAIQTAYGLVDGGAPCRGGPWAGGHLSDVSLGLAAEVRRRAARAPTPAAARTAVLEYALGLDDASPLKKHVLDHCYTDSAERRMAPPRRGRSYQSGNAKRIRWGLTPGSAQYNQHKWGSNVQLNRERDNERQQKRRYG